jgi:hypothetical protein
MNLAVLLKNNFDFSQLSYVASLQINSFLENYTNSKLVVCTLNNNPQVFKVRTANIPVTELNSFDGLIITTCIDTTLIAKNLVRHNDIIFYVWDLEWLHTRKDYFKNIEAFRDVTLATRSQVYAAELMKYSGTATNIITPNFNLSQLLNGYQQSRQRNN